MCSVLLEFLATYKLLLVLKVMLQVFHLQTVYKDGQNESSPKVKPKLQSTHWRLDAGQVLNPSATIVLDNIQANH